MTSTDNQTEMVGLSRSVIDAESAVIEPDTQIIARPRTSMRRRRTW